MKTTEISMCVKCNQDNFPYYNTKDIDERNFNQEYVASEDMKMFFKGLNNLNKQQNDKYSNDPDNVDISPIVNCKYYDLNTFENHKIDDKSLSILHLNIGSLGAHKEELETILTRINLKFDIIGISETKIKS